MRYVEGRCPECGTRNAAAVDRDITEFNNDILDFVKCGYSVRILTDPTEDVSVLKCPETCSRKLKQN